MVSQYVLITSVSKSSRRVGNKYLDTKGRVGTWDGKEMRCPHNRRRAQCKECGGSAICQHEKRKTECKQCAGVAPQPNTPSVVAKRTGYPLLTAIPLSQRRVGGKYVDTKGNVGNWNGKDLRCDHNRERRYCKECGGSQICQHNRVRAQCKDCGGSAICEHKRQRATCKDCGGSQICEHGRVRYQCRHCGGTGMCQHGKMRSSCADCDGTSTCEHGKRKSRCRICKPNPVVDWIGTGVSAILGLSSMASPSASGTEQIAEANTELTSSIALLSAVNATSPLPAHSPSAENEDDIKRSSSHLLSSSSLSADTGATSSNHRGFESELAAAALSMIGGSVDNSAISDEIMRKDVKTEE
jgi:hypothetical protein